MKGARGYPHGKDQKVERRKRAEARAKARAKAKPSSPTGK